MMTNIRPVPFDRQRQLYELYVWNVLEKHWVQKECLRCGRLFTRCYASKGLANNARRHLKYCANCV